MTDFSGSVEDDGCLPPLAYRYCITCDICGSLAASTVLARRLRVWIPDDIRFRPSSDLVFNQVNSVPNSVFSTNVVGAKQSILSCRVEFSYSGTGMACVCKASFCNPIWCFSLPCKVGLSLYFYLQTKWLFTLLFTLICKMYIIVCIYNQVFSWSGLFFYFIFFIFFFPDVFYRCSIYWDWIAMVNLYPSHHIELRRYLAEVADPHIELRILYMYLKDPHNYIELRISI